MSSDIKIFVGSVPEYYTLAMDLALTRSELSAAGFVQLEITAGWISNTAWVITPMKSWRVVGSNKKKSQLHNKIATDTRQMLLDMQYFKEAAKCEM